MKSERITTMIVDPDAGIAEEFKTLLSSIPGVEVLGAAPDAAGALVLLYQSIPDVIFLEIELPDKNGFEFLKDLRQMNINSCIMVHTRTREYAVDAVRSSVFDYLVKPVCQPELMEALTRYKYHYPKAGMDKKFDRLFMYLNRHEKVRFNTRHGFTMIDPSDIAYCKADWSYTEIYLMGDKMTMVSMNIGKIEELLDPARFIRINRSILINISTLISVDRKNHQCTIQYDGRNMEFHVTSVHLQNLKDINSG